MKREGYFLYAVGVVAVFLMLMAYFQGHQVDDKQVTPIPIESSWSAETLIRVDFSFKRLGEPRVHQHIFIQAETLPEAIKKVENFYSIVATAPNFHIHKAEEVGNLLILGP